MCSRTRPPEPRAPPGRPRCSRATCCGGTSGSAPSTIRRPSDSVTGSASTTSWWRATTPTPTRRGPTPSASLRRPGARCPRTSCAPWPGAMRPGCSTTRCPRWTTGAHRRHDGHVVTTGGGDGGPPEAPGLQFLPPCAGPVVDADGHVVEPMSAWTKLPDAYRPRLTTDAAGYDHVVIGDTEVLAVPLGNLATPGSTFDDPSTFRSLADAQPGGWDPGLRLADMDAEGIDQAVLYPSIGLYFSVVEDPAAAIALAAAYDDWLAGYCAADPSRLFGAAMLSLQDPAAAARELHRAVTELGFVAGFVRPNPCRGRSLSDRAYDVVWEAAEELHVPIALHEGSSVIVPTLGSDRPFNPLVLHAVSHSFEQMLACAQLIAFGVLERPPGLRVV